MAHRTATKELLERVDAANRQGKLFRKNDVLVVALSGGPDSTALLAILAVLRKKYALTLHAAHLDHGLSRAAASHRRHALSAAKRFEARFHLKKTDVAAKARRERRSLEEAGRRARYDFLRSVAGKTGASAIVTGHTLDDQAETVLLRLLRGTGPKGLAGIRPVRDERGTPVIRPFLGVEKKTLLSFLRENKIGFSTDPTNRSKDFTRNRVRHGLLPYLAKTFNPRAKHALASLADACAETQDAVERSAAAVWSRASVKAKRGVSLRVAALKKLHPAVLSEVLFRAASEASGAPRLSRAHIESLKALVASPEAVIQTHLPQGMKALKTGGFLRLTLH
jgi:tRNA(Ile)-lysidine synthase